MKEGANFDFQTVAILGLAAEAGILSETQVGRLKNGLYRLAGRSAVVSGVPMAFSADAVGILGVALGTAAVADAEITGQMVGWAARFLKASYERDRAEDWQRCLYAAADRKLGSRLGLAIPGCIAGADTRIALLAKGLIECADAQVRQDVAHTLEVAYREAPDDLDCEDAALRLAALDWVIQTKSGPARAEARARGKSRRRAIYEDIEAVRARVRQMKREKMSAFMMCKSLGDDPRPQGAAWANLTWPEAWKSVHRNSVKVWLSKNSKAKA